jgi:hypothetical protein
LANPGSRASSHGSTHGGCFQRRSIQQRWVSWVELQLDAAFA